MPLPGALARFNKRVTNRLLRPIARVLPGFGTLIHTGRSSGTHYETPLNMVRDESRFIVALTYGAEVDWLKNTRASSAVQIVTRGEAVAVGSPYDLTTEEGMAAMPVAVRLILKSLDISGFVAFPVAG